jgi:hypothetical protein
LTNAAAIVQAIGASGAIVRLEPSAFERLVGRIDDALVVRSQGSSMLRGERYSYLMGYRGLVFYSESRTPLALPGRTEILEAKSIWVP